MGRGFGGSVLRVRVSTDGTVNYNSAYYSLGFAPGFYIDTGQTE